MNTALLAQLLDQLPTLFLCQISAGLHRIDQQLQLRDLKNSGSDVVTAILAGNGNDIHTIILQGGNIGINGFSVTGNIMLTLQHIDQLRCSHEALLVGVFFEIITDVQNL